MLPRGGLGEGDLARFWKLRDWDPHAGRRPGFHHEVAPLRAMGFDTLTVDKMHGCMSGLVAEDLL